MRRRNLQMVLLAIAVTVIAALVLTWRASDRAAFYYNRGLAWAKEREHDKAIADYTEAIRIDPNHVGAYNHRGRAWVAKLEFDKAIADYTEAIQLAPKDVDGYYYRAQALIAKGETDKAIADYTEASRIDPKDAFAYYNRGLAWARREPDKAIADFTEAIRIDPKNAGAYYIRGLVWTKKGELDKAIADYTEAIRIDPKDEDGYRALAWIFATCPEAKYRNGQRAVEMATKQCDLSNWKDWAGFDSLAAACAELGDFPNAVKWQEKAIERTPEGSMGELRSRLDLYKAHKPYREEPKQ